MNELTAITPETPVIVFQNVRVLTTELLATLYGTAPTNITSNFSSNANRFISGKHYFKLEGEELRKFKELHKESVEISPQVDALVLWTDRGAVRHAQFLDTDEAWSVFAKLEDACFNPSLPQQALQLAATQPLSGDELVQMALAYKARETQQAANLSGARHV